jgi:choloylglycine hydrolase
MPDSYTLLRVFFFDQIIMYNLNDYETKTIYMKSTRGLTIIILLLLNFDIAIACTGLRLIAKDGSVIFARTMEWGTFDLKSRVVVIPRNFPLQDKMPDGKNGIAWKTKYGAVGIDALNKDVLVDGMNEKGLTVSCFYHEGYAVYSKYQAAKADSTLSILAVPPYILTTCTNIEEVKLAMKKIKVIGIVEPSIGMAPPLHLGVTDASGTSIVIEFTNGVTTIHNAPLGVITNGPNYDWHMENMINYVDLETSLALRKINNLSDVRFGGGTRFFGVPGDLTSPSRLLRVAAYSSTARPTADGKEAIYEAFRILDNFNLPVGSAAEGGGKIDNASLRSATNWTTAYDTKGKKMYYHTMHNRRVRELDLDDLNFDSKKIVRLPLDIKKEQDIDNITTKIGNQ